MHPIIHSFRELVTSCPALGNQQGTDTQVPTLTTGKTKAGRDVLERTSQVRRVECDGVGAEWSGRASQGR